MHAAYEVLKALSSGNYISGQRLASNLNLSRARVWQAVKYLRATGLEIFAIPGKGYKLSNNIDLLDSNQIQHNLSKDLNCDTLRLEIFHQLGSTNDYLLDAIDRPIKPGHVCLAEEQLRGRGRQGRVWNSPIGKSISMSLYWRLDRDHPNLTSLSLVVGIAVFKALTSIYGLKNQLGLKWPNDIWYQDKKLCGILIDSKPSKMDSKSLDLVIGIGCNTRCLGVVNPGENPRTSLEEIFQQEIVRNEVIAGILNHLIPSLRRFAQEGFKAFMQDWQNYDLLKNRWVTLKSAGDKTLSGYCLGINESGALYIDDNDQRKAFISGDVTVRPYAAVG